MKFEIYTLQNGGTKVAEGECFEFDLFRKLDDVISSYDRKDHNGFELDKIVLISDLGRKLVSAQNRCRNGYSWCCWQSRNKISKKWQKEFNRAFNQSPQAYMGW